MTLIDDGVIKFDFSDFSKTTSVAKDEYQALEKWREKLFKLTLIGEYPSEKVGYGNISMRMNYQNIKSSHFPQFIISGTQTGGLPKLDGQHYTRVIDGDIEHLKISCHGPILASSESLTHAAIYLCSPKINAVFHIHNTKIWENMLAGDYPQTPKEIPYGTSQMANAVKKIVATNTSGCLVMAGHQDGVIIYGEDLDQVGKLTLKLDAKYNS